MSIATENFSMPDIRLLAAAPHRFMFFIGATNVLMAMLWWTIWLLDASFQWFGLAQQRSPGCASSTRATFCPNCRNRLILMFDLLQNDTI